MGEKLARNNSSLGSTGRHAVPALLVTLEPRLRAFWSDLADFLWPWQPATPFGLLAAGEFWPDVFVRSPLPWGRFAQSAVFHTAAIAVLWSSAQLWPQSTRVVEQATPRRPDVLYYEAPEYLPPLNTGDAQPKVRQKGDPEFSRQAIISVPPEPDNRRQTIVTPPKLPLDHDVPLPNVVAWNHTAPAVPLAATSPAAKPNLPVLPVDVVAPPPDVENTHPNRAPSLSQSVISPPPELNAANSRTASGVSPPSVVDPPPALAPAATRRMGDINIAASPVVAPAPQLPMEARLARASAAPGVSAGPAAVVPPPPSLPGAAGKDDRLIALNLHPAAPSGPVEVPPGNRLGTFAATPEGKLGAAGAPDVPGNAKPSSQYAGLSPGKSGWRTAGVPSGLQVGATPKTDLPASTGGGLAGSRVAEAALPPSLPIPHHNNPEVVAIVPTELERTVFGDRKLYSMTLNTPNLNSAAGSWVMHFAEINQDPRDKSELTPPVATQEVDPGYPLELMRQNVQGTVTLSAVIRSDGTVGDVYILSSMDERLDEYARKALARWKFRPAEKNGKQVAVQAVVKIPFRPMKRSGF